MSVPDLNEEEWKDIFFHLRTLVMRSGYGKWDASIMDALTETEYRAPEEASVISSERNLSAFSLIKTYSLGFRNYLSIRSSLAINNSKEGLKEILTDENKNPVDTAEISTGETSTHLLDPSQNLDGMISRIDDFIKYIDGKENSFINKPDGDLDDDFEFDFDK